MWLTIWGDTVLHKGAVKAKRRTNGSHQQSSCGFGRTCSSRLKLLMLKVNTGWVGWLEKCLVIPAGKDRTISPLIFTTHLEETPWTFSLLQSFVLMEKISSRYLFRSSSGLQSVSLLARVSAFKVGVDGFCEGSRHRQCVLWSHGEWTGSSGASCPKRTPWVPLEHFAS